MAKKASVNQKQASKAGSRLASDDSTKNQKTDAAKKLNAHKKYHNHN